MSLSVPASVTVKPLGDGSPPSTSGPVEGPDDLTRRTSAPLGWKPREDGVVRMPTIALDGVDLYYEERGSGPPVLLIHGNGGGAPPWDDVVDGLAADHRVIVPDRRGFRRSQADFPKDIRVHADDMAALLEGLDAAPATVVGWSA